MSYPPHVRIKAPENFHQKTTDQRIASFHPPMSSFTDLSKTETLKSLNEFLADKSYIEGYVAFRTSLDDDQYLWSVFKRRRKTPPHE